MSLFRFKQFTIDQSGCTMKVNTDGVLLGAMARALNPRRILDIGTGTGVIALMLAQRFASSEVDAIEIDSLAANAAQQNFVSSSFSARLSCRTLPLDEYRPEDSYDLMVSNPPYFLQSLKNPDERKQLARHTDMSFFDVLLSSAREWLAPQGSLQLILPVSLADTIVRKAKDEYGMTEQWQCNIYSFESQPPIRRVLAIGRSPMDGVTSQDDFMIYERKGVYSQAYRELLKDFFLAF